MIADFGLGGGLPDPEELRRYALSSQMPSMGAPSSSPQAGAPPAPPSMSAPPAQPQTYKAPYAPIPQTPAAPMAPTAPQPSAAPPAAPTWRNTEDSWINFLGTQGLQGTRQGFFGQGGTSVQDMVNRFNQYTNQHAKFIGGPSGDLVDFGDGRGPVDVRTAQGEFWYSEPGQGTPGGPGSGGPGGPGGGPGTGGIDPRTGGPGGGGGVDSAMRQALLRLMGRAEQPVDANDPVFQQRYLPIRNALERNAQLSKEQAAESAATRGQSFGGGNDQATFQSINERLGQQEGQALGEQLGQEIQARRQDLMGALQLANSIGARDEALKIQRELAQLDNQYRYAALGQNQSQFNDQFGLQREFGTYDRNRQSMLDLMG